MRFPTEFDAVDIVTDELKEKLLPVSRKLMDYERDRAERAKIRKRSKGVASSQKDASGDVVMGEGAASASASTSDEATPAPAPEVGGELQEEFVYREKELKELEALVDPELKADIGSSVSGLYELVGAYHYIHHATQHSIHHTGIVTHKGAAADAGHYMAYVKKSVFHPVSRSSDPQSKQGTLEEDDEDWYKFDDNKVSVFID